MNITQLYSSGNKDLAEIEMFPSCLQPFYYSVKCQEKIAHLTSILKVYVIYKLLGSLLDKLYTEEHF